MQINRQRIKNCLDIADFKTLFIEELGWDKPPSNETVKINENDITLKAIAEKRGLVAFLVEESEIIGKLDNSLRRKIDNALGKYVHEHLIIFLSKDKTRQQWQWIRREKGKTAALRTEIFQTGQSGERLIQKLVILYVSLNEEANFTLSDATSRVKAAFDIEKVTKKFYEEFKKKHDAFLKFIEGIPDDEFRRWYASVMLNRLMFIYFLQKKGFLDVGNLNYLKSRLDLIEKSELNFYRDFLCPLFFEGFAKKEQDRSDASTKLLGKIPYLNGGLFTKHQIEEKYGLKIEISNAAFEDLFEFFEKYQWHLDEKSLQRDNEINPDVLGYIFEKYINQKQMGAYYTKEDVTDYITKNTIIPWLFQNAVNLDKVAFEDGGYVWRLLSENPETYIYNSVRHGTKYPLPDNVAAGITDVTKRGEWNKVAPSKFGLPTEIWREVIARRERYEIIRAKAENGEINKIEELITYNLNIRQFARDIIQYAESPDLLWAFWKGISSIKILDPACGSGAFLFAALNIQYDLYDACLERMEQFVASASDNGSGNGQYKYDFQVILAQVAKHPNRDYFISKSIIIANLYGVDIMEEAVEICKLRLFLKLASQLESADQIEPLPDIDFNICAGNTLIGYTSMDDVKTATVANGFDFDNRAEKIEAAAQKLDQAFRLFRESQTTPQEEILLDKKNELRSQLSALEKQLNGFLAKDYGVEVGDDSDASAKFLKWKASHKPFHWLIEFYGIVKGGGFDVVVGNPPYVKASEVRKDYCIRGFETDRCSDMYAWIMERAAKLTSVKGFYGMIVPLSLTFSGNFQSLRDYLLKNFSANWFSSFARIPAALFSAEVRVRNTIHIGQKSGGSGNRTTITHRWFEEARPHLIERIEYAEFNSSCWNGLIPKLGNQKLLTALEQTKQQLDPLDIQITKQANRNQLYFKKSAYNWVSFAYEPAPAYGADGKLLTTTESGLTSFTSIDAAALSHTLLNGKIAFIWWVIVGDDFHVTKTNFESLPFIIDIPETDRARLIELSKELNKKMIENIVFKLNASKRIGNYNLALCREITDKSDTIWARHLKLSGCQLEIELAYYQTVKTNFDESDDDEVIT